MQRLNPGRYAGLLYLLACLPAVFNYMVVEPSLVVYQDAQATAHNILGSETLFRLGIVAELSSSIGFIFLALAMYRLFRHVDREKAITMVILVLVSVPVSLLNVANHVVVLRLVKGGGHLAAIGTPQLQAMAMVFIRAHSSGVFIAQIFWGLWLIPLGLLVRRSRFAPSILGTLLIFNGLAYPLVTLIWLLAPSYAVTATKVALIPQLGEAWFMLWLLIKGVPEQAIDGAPSVTVAPREGSATPQLAGVMMLVIASFCGTVRAQTNDAQVLSDRGSDAVVHGDLKRAAKLFSDAIALRPNVAKYHYQLGDAYQAMALTAGMLERMSLIEKAKAEWERAVQLDPNSVPARESLIEYYLLAPAMMGGSEATAKQLAGEIAKRDAIEGHRAYARIYTAAERPDLARNEYAAMLKSDGGSARARYIHGVYLMLTEKNYSAASAEFEEALKLDPAYLVASFQIGHVSALSGQSLVHGEESLKKYLSYRPKDDEPSIARAHYWLGAIYELQHRKAEARASYAASLAINPNQKDAETARERVSK